MFEFRNGKDNLPVCYLDTAEQFWGPSSVLYNGYRCSFPVKKRPELEADYSYVSSVQVTSG